MYNNSSSERVINSVMYKNKSLCMNVSRFYVPSNMTVLPREGGLFIESEIQSKKLLLLGWIQT